MRPSDGLFTRTSSDRTRESGFTPKECRYSEGGEILEQVVQTSLGCPVPASGQGQVEQGFEPCGLVESVPASDRGVRME